MPYFALVPLTVDQFGTLCSFILHPKDEGSAVCPEDLPDCVAGRQLYLQLCLDQVDEPQRKGQLLLLSLHRLFRYLLAMRVGGLR